MADEKTKETTVDKIDTTPLTVVDYILANDMEKARVEIQKEVVKIVSSEINSKK